MPENKLALEFALTKENCLTHSYFISLESLINLKKKGAEFFAFILNKKQIGFMAIEESNENGIYYLEKLAILPEYRHKNYGKMLIKFAGDYILSKKGKKISIGIINKHALLKIWYKSQGFKETFIKEFPNLPFDVCFMEKVL